LFGLPGIGLLLSALKATFLILGVLLIGTEVEGRILEKRELLTKDDVIYRVQYAYALDGQESTHEVIVSADDYLAVRAGGSVTVRTLPWMTTGNWPRFRDHSPFREAAWPWRMALLWNGILSVFAWKLYWVPARQRWLVRWGEPARGIVRDLKTSLGNPSCPCFELTYEFTVDGNDPLGPQLLTGSVTSTNNIGQPSLLFFRWELLKGHVTTTVAPVKDMRVGDTLTVLYDPRRPKRSLVYKLADYTVRP
jgi:hypothetical protein